MPNGEVYQLSLDKTLLKKECKKTEKNHKNIFSILFLGRHLLPLLLLLGSLNRCYRLHHNHLTKICNKDFWYTLYSHNQRTTTVNKTFKMTLFSLLYLPSNRHLPPSPPSFSPKEKILFTSSFPMVCLHAYLLIWLFSLLLYLWATLLSKSRNKKSRFSRRNSKPVLGKKRKLKERRKKIGVKFVVPLLHINYYLK